jgi:hypothetical protein
MCHSATAEKRFQMLQQNAVTPAALELLKSIYTIEQMRTHPKKEKIYLYYLSC